MGTDFKAVRPGTCPDCGQPTIIMNQRFRPPKKDDDKKWLTVKFLVDNGFRYQHIYEAVEKKGKGKVDRITVAYPENLNDAREFVLKYKDQRILNL